MSQLDSSSADLGAPQGVLVKKPKTNIYTVMLILAFVAMCFACLFLYLEQAKYNRPPQNAQRSAPAASVALVDVAPNSVTPLV